MKNRPLTLVGAFFVLLAVFLAVRGVQNKPETKTTTIEVREVVKTKKPRTTQTPSSEIVVVEYSTKAFFQEGEPEKTENQ